VNQALNQDLQSFTNIQNQFGNFPVFTQNALNQSLNLGNISTELSNLQTKNSTASSDNDYINMMNVLLQINLPQSVQQSSNAASFPFIPLNNTINLDALVGAGGGTYDSTRQNDYLNSILSWDLNNISMTITYNEFSAVYGFSVVPILDVATLNLAESQPINNAYLFIKNSGKVYLDKTYPTTGSYYYVPLTGSAQTVQFATTQLFSPDQLPAFIAPSLSQISLTQQSASTSNNNNLILIVVIGTIAVIGVVSYILIGKWYQRRYESYLFKDRNDLYNIINYIHASKNKGLKGIEIEKNLRKSKWTAEQISYVMKRYAGKKVGILGFKKKK